MSASPRCTTKISPEVAASGAIFTILYVGSSPAYRLPSSHLLTQYAITFAMMVYKNEINSLTATHPPFAKNVRAVTGKFIIAYLSKIVKNFWGKYLTNTD